MVAMQMGDEDGADLRETQSRTAQLYLRALTTVHKKQLATHLYDLRRREMLQRRQCTATAQYMYFERLQVILHLKVVKRVVFQLHIVTIGLFGLLATVFEGLLAVLVYQ